LRLVESSLPGLPAQRLRAFVGGGKLLAILQFQKRSIADEAASARPPSRLCGPFPELKHVILVDRT